MSGEAKEKAAAAGFVAVLAAVGGPVGLVVAAVAVGLERAWNGDAGRGATAERYRQARLDNRAWLAADRVRQQAWRRSRRDWLAAGGDPAAEPARPSTAARAGAWLHRVYARAAVAAEDFGRGARDGWRAADRVRRAGGGFADIVRARPLVDGQPAPLDPTGVVDPPLGAGWRKPSPRPHSPTARPKVPAGDVGGNAAINDPPAPTPGGPGVGGGPGTAEPVTNPGGRDVGATRNEMNPDVVGRPSTADERAHVRAVLGVGDPAEVAVHEHDHYAGLDLDELARRIVDAHDAGDYQTVRFLEGIYAKAFAAQRGEGNSNGGGHDMSTAQSDTNLDVAETQMKATGAFIASCAETLDELNRRRERLAKQIQQAQEHANTPGAQAPAATRAALDAAAAAVTTLGAHLGAFSTGTAATEEQVDAARQGLRTAHDIKDDLDTTGTDAGFVDKARSVA